MKIAVSAIGSSIDTEIDPRFGRSRYFIVVDPDTMQFEALDNTGAMARDGAGVFTAQMICDKDIEVVLTGNCGPNAFQVLSAAEVKVVTGISGNVKNAIQIFLSGKQQVASQPNVPGHFGIEKTLDVTLLNDLRHPIRLKILSCLMKGEKNVSELMELVGGVQQGRLSSHLGWLRRLGHVYSHQSGRYMYYGIMNPRIRKVLEALAINSPKEETSKNKCNRR